MTKMNREQIQQAIPHRDPFLWLDEVVELTPERIVARKTVTADLPVFAGHYPHFPVLPGVLQLEAAFQAGAVLIAQSDPPADDAVPVVTRVNDVKFRHLVRPGDVMEIEVTLTERLANAYFLTGKVSTAGKVSARLQFACAATTP